MTKVGVVIPTHNSELWIQMTLDSVRRQTFTDWVCVIADDGSTDSTVDLAISASERDQRIKFARQSERGTPSAARNLGMRSLPSVDFVAFLDSDDIWLPDALERLVQTALAYPQAVGVFGLAELIDSSGNRQSPGAHIRRQYDRRVLHFSRGRARLVSVPKNQIVTQREMVVYNPFWPPATGIFRYESIFSAGEFDETYRRQEDWEMWLRVLRRGPLIPLDHVVAEYRKHGENLTADWVLNYIAQDRLRYEFIRDVRQPLAIRRYSLHAWRAILRSGSSYEAGMLKSALLALDLRAARAALLRVVIARIRAVWPRGPRPTVLGARLRPRGLS